MKQYVRSIVIHFLSLLLLFTALPLRAQDFHFTSSRKRENINFKFIKNLIIVQVAINNKGPYNFILDTGISLVLITDPAVLSELDIKNYRVIKINGLGEKSGVNAYTIPSVNIKISDDIEGNLPAAVLQNDLFDLSGFTGMPVHGLIGYDFFNSFIVKIKYTLNTITVYKNETAYAPRKGSKIQLEIEDRKPYVVSDVTLNNNKTVNSRLIIDTGAGHPLSLETDNEGIPFNVPEENIPASLGIGLGGTIKGYLSRIPLLKIGNFELTNVIAAFPDYPDVAAKLPQVHRNGSIGNSILKRFEVVFDYHHNSLYLKPIYTYQEPFEYDMTGIQLAFSGEKLNRIFVYNVDRGSVADKAALKPGDEILAINFQPVSELGMEKIEAIFNSYDNRGLMLDIFSANAKKRERVFMTLKRRI